MQVDGCGCDFESTESLIHEELQPMLSRLVRLPFFRIWLMEMISFMIGLLNL